MNSASPPKSESDSLKHFNYKSGDPGAVIVILQHQKTIIKKRYGLADLQSGKPLTTNDNFNIGSLIKQFTSYALLTLFYQVNFH